MRTPILYLVTVMTAAATPALASQTNEVLSACKNTPGCSYQKNGNHYDGWDKTSSTIFTCWPKDGCVSARSGGTPIEGGTVGGIKLPAIGAKATN